MKILHVYPQLNSGGTEMVIYNILHYGQDSEFRYELLTEIPGNNEAKFKNIGIPIHHIPFSDGEAYFNRLVNFMRDGGYSAVHVHMNSHLPIVLKAAKEAGINCRIAHSHNARLDIPVFMWNLLAPLHHRYEKYATHLVGCSRLALRWLFPFRWKHGNIINNGIDMDAFRYNPITRESVRSDLGLSPTSKVFIHVGRCTPQKNQKFILDLANNRRDKDEVYLLVGEGPDLKSLKDYAKKLNLSNVRFLGLRTDIPQLLAASDIFLFPSIYEGLGIVAIEAQASGLNVITSDQLPPEADLGLGNFLPIALKNIKQWEEFMDKDVLTDKERENLSHKAFSSSYNIKTAVKELKKIYSDSTL